MCLVNNATVCNTFNLEIVTRNEKTCMQLASFISSLTVQQVEIRDQNKPVACYKSSPKQDAGCVQGLAKIQNVCTSSLPHSAHNIINI
jgi:hypothetical protein